MVSRAPTLSTIAGRQQPAPPPRQQGDAFARLRARAAPILDLVDLLLGEALEHASGGHLNELLSHTAIARCTLAQFVPPGRRGGSTCCDVRNAGGSRAGCGTHDTRDSTRSPSLNEMPPVHSSCLIAVALCLAHVMRNGRRRTLDLVLLLVVLVDVCHDPLTSQQLQETVPLTSKRSQPAVAVPKLVAALQEKTPVY